MTTLQTQLAFSTAKLLPVLQPLSTATETALKPASLLRTDFLEIDCDAEGEHFIIQSTRLVEQPYEMIMFKPEHELLELGKGLFHRTGSCSHSAAERWQHRIPEKRRLGYGKWKCAATDFSALVIYHAWPTERVFFSNETAKLMYELLLVRFLAQSKASVNTAKFKADKVVPDMPEDFVEHPELPLTPYQRVALVNSLDNAQYSLFMEQGTGKTAVAINRISLEGKRMRDGENKMYRALVLCPKALRMNWENEFVRFATTAGKVTIMRGGQVERVRNIVDGVRDEEDCNWSAVVCSVDSVSNSWNAIKRVPWDLVVLDESHSIKNPATKRFKTLRQLNNGSAKMILTGTPITNHLFDLWSQFEFLGSGMSGFTTFNNFRSFHGKFENRSVQGNKIAQLVGLKGVPLIQERLARISFLLKKDEADLGLPDLVYDMYEVGMTKLQTEWYIKIRDMLAVQIEEALKGMEDGDKTLSVDHILTMLLRLAQITSGHVKWDDDEDTGKRGDIEQIPGGNPKVDAVLEMLKEQEDVDANCKTIIWATFVEDVRILSKTLADAGINHVCYHAKGHPAYRANGAFEAAERFNNEKECKVFIGNPASGGEGLNLIGYDKEDGDNYDTYCGHEIFFSCNWSAVQRSQAEARAHRRGTRNTVRVTDLMINGTIDEEIRARVMAKRQNALAIQDIREILGNILHTVTAGD